MDIFEHLQDEHRRMDQLMDKIMSTNDVGLRQSLLAELEIAYNKHARAEDEVFYSRFDDVDALREYVSEARLDHQVCSKMLQEIRGLKADDESWRVRFIELKDALDHHFEIEEGPIFGLVSKLMKPEEPELLERRYALREQLPEQGSAP